MNSDTGQSQKNSSAGRAAIAISVFVLIWDSFVFGLLVPIRDIPFWFKAIFVVAAFGVTTLAVFTWRNWILSGSAQLQLSSDPVPHGVTVSAKFELTRKIRAQNWSVEASLDEQYGKSSLNTIWRQKFPAQRMSANIICADFVLPSEYSPKNISKSLKLCQRTLTLKADNLTWSFLLKARNASNSEKLFGEQDEASIGNNLPTYTPEDLAKNRQYAGWIFGAGFIVSLLIAIGQFASIFDFDLIGRTKAQLGLGAYSSQVDTEEFDVRVTNYAMNNWAFRGRLVGKGRVNNGELRVRVEGLDVQATNECKGDAKKCEVASVRLLLSQSGDNSFSTPAQSEHIEVNAQLQDITRWSLPAEQVGTELVMKLPTSVDVDTMRLKLEIRTAAGSTVYPDSGPYLALHRALAMAGGQKDPCEKITSKLMLVQAGCHQQLLALHGKPLGLVSSLFAQGERAWLAARQIAAKLGLGSTPEDDMESLDYLLLEALRYENFSAVDALLTMGANPNADDNYQIARTPLGYAAASNETSVVERLLRAGAKPDARKRNERNQIVTPVTQALRTDAAKSIEQLIAAGASTRTDDPQGWTPMHIAAYESAKLSLAVLVKAGADVNERTPAYRQQNVLQTALQFGDIETISTLLKLGADTQFKDNKGENACGWAKFFKRNDQIQALVCPQIAAVPN